MAIKVIGTHAFNDLDGLVNNFDNIVYILSKKHHDSILYGSLFLPLEEKWPGRRNLRF